MNELMVYQKEYEIDGWMENFRTIYYNSQMKYLASDLIKQGLSISDINQAVSRAISSARSAGLNTKRHFLPLYTQLEEGIFRDCKTTKMGLALILLNANPERQMVGKWQLKILKNFLNE